MDNARSFRSWIGRLWPRSVRGQLVAGLIVLELIVLGVFVMLLLRAERSELLVRTGRRILYEASLSAAEGAAALHDGDPGALAGVLAGARHDPGVKGIEILDASGKVLAMSSAEKVSFPSLSLSQAGTSQAPLLSIGKDGRMNAAIASMRLQGVLYGYVIVLPSTEPDLRELHQTLRITLFAAIVALAGCTWLAGLLANNIARPLARLLKSTRQLIRNPEDKTALPLATRADNEVGELTLAFNRLIMTIQEQRAQSRETLALLDSILANAPIGFAFFDRRHRVVRVNTFLAKMDGLAVSRYTGKTVTEVFPGAAGQRLDHGVARVLEGGEPVRDLELEGEANDRALPARRGAVTAPRRTWIVNLYPIGTEDEPIRWVGAVLVDATGRKQAEDALRKTEKLATAGRLAASIAHEINNPLEAVTNLLYLIRQADLDEESAQYVDMAQHELARVSEITQQTLRFYRQSTLPGPAKLGELMDSVLTLHHGRLVAMQIKVTREYDAEAQLFCFSGEIRQLFTNLISNAVDAMMPDGGQVTIRIRKGRGGNDRELEGVVVTLADTGSGIPPETLPHIFEPFYTTKEATGTGLGLWVSTQILRKHEAQLRVRSRTRTEGGVSGTVFRVFFPANGARSEIREISIPVDI